MKTFSIFIKEAVETQASSQAKRMGLVGDGHGDWFDSKGKLVAKTVKGQLKVFSGKASQKKESDSSERQQPANITAKKPSAYKGGKVRLGKTPQASSNKSSSSSAASAAAYSQQPQQSVRDDIVTVAFGKFNPPTKGHETLLKAMSQVSAGGNFYIFPSRTQDNKRNPLDPELKIEYMKEMFPDYAERIIDSDEFKTIFDALSFLNQEGYTSVNVVCGEERVAEIDSLTAKANGQAYQYQSINVMSSGPKDSDAESGSSSVARKAAADGDYFAFKKTMPSNVDESIIKQLFMDLRESMNIKEDYNLWEIAPDLDWKGLRDNYVTKNIFRVGTLVENCNSGLRGSIIRSGTNHLICVTEDGVMFKSWVKDVCEVN